MAWCGVMRGGVMVVVRCGAVRCGVMHGGGTVRCGAVRCGAVWCGGGAVRYATPASARDANISLFPGHPRDTPGEQVSHPEHRNIRSDNPAQHNNTTRQHRQQAT